MTTRMVGASLTIHIAVLFLIIMISPIGESTGFVSKALSVRIRNPGINAAAGRELPLTPLPESTSSARSDNREEDRKTVSALPPPPPLADALTSFLTQTTAPGRQIPDAPALSSGSDLPQFDLPDPLFDDPDPLAGLEDAFEKQQTESVEPVEDSWRVYWESGRKRDILSFPVIDESLVPLSQERLLNVTMSIDVSPQGNVLSARIFSPGSGDVRIDRYIHSLALQLTLEPALDADKTQLATLKFLFREEDG